LQKGDRVLLKKVGFKGKHKLENKWKRDPYIIESQPDTDIPFSISCVEFSELSFSLLRFGLGGVCSRTISLVGRDKIGSNDHITYISSLEKRLKFTYKTAAKVAEKASKRHKTRYDLRVRHSNLQKGLEILTSFGSSM
jgi:hypothetical protein